MREIRATFEIGLAFARANATRLFRAANPIGQNAERQAKDSTSDVPWDES
jgi:hypothetical protein